MRKTSLLFITLLASLFVFAQGSEEVELVVQKGHTSEIADICFSPDGKYIATSGKDRHLYIYDVQKGLFAFGRELEWKALNLAFTTDGQFLHFNANGTFYRWDYRADTLTNMDCPIYADNYRFTDSMAFLVESHYLTFSLTKLSDLKCADNPLVYQNNQKNDKDKMGRILAVEYLPKKKVIISTRARGINVWDLSEIDFNDQYEHPKLIHQVTFEKPIWKESFATIIGQNVVGNRLYTTSFVNNSRTGLVHRHTLNLDDYSLEHGTVQIAADKPKKEYNQVYGFTVAPDEKMLALSIWNRDSGRTRTLLFNTESGELIREIEPDGQLCFSQDSKYLAVGESEGQMHVFEVKSGREVRRTPNMDKDFGLDQVLFNPYWPILTSSSSYGGFDFWDLSRLEKVTNAEGRSSSGLTSNQIRFTSMGDTAALATRSTSITYFDLNQMKPIKGLKQYVSGHDLYGFDFNASDDSVFMIYRDFDQRWWIVKVKCGESHFENEDIKIRKRLKIKPEKYGRPKDIAFHREARLAAVTYWDLDHRHSELEIIDLRDEISSKVYHIPEKKYLGLRNKYLPATLSFNHDGTLIAIGSSSNYSRDSFYVFDLTSEKFIEVPVLARSPIVFFNQSNQILASQISQLNTQYKSQLIELDGRSTPLNEMEMEYALSIDRKDRLTAITGSSNVINIYGNDSMKKVVSIYDFEEEGEAFITPDNYYKSSKGAMKRLAFKVGDEVYFPENFDLRFNRPDIVAKRLGYASPAFIRSLERAYQRRLRKLGFSEAMLGLDFHIPRIKISNRQSLPATSTNPNVTLVLQAYDSLYNLDRLNVWVNGVPEFGMYGLDLRSKSKNELELSVNIALSEGMNKIQVSCLNEKGSESFKEAIFIQNGAERPEAQTYYIGVGVSTYKDSSYNLTYATKDVEDLQRSLKKVYPNLKSYTLNNEQVTKENIQAIKSMLLKTNVDDRIIVSLSGHGVLSDSLDFYYATYDTDFDRPEDRGLLYEDLERLLDSIPARKKLVMIDACHSGEVDRDEQFEFEDADTNVAQYVSKGAKVTRLKSSLGLQNSFELMNELFDDLSKGNGAVVISAAGGMEYAFEGRNWNNGVFTYCVRQALEKGKADKMGNGDGVTTVLELKKYVSEEVPRLTGGRQKPTSRQENLELDFELW